MSISRSIARAAFVSALALGVSQASALSIPVTNFSFESPAQAPGGNNSGVITGWTITGNGGGAGVFFPNGNGGLGNPLPAPAQGSQYAFLEAATQNSTTSITTTSAVTTVTPGVTYLLTAALGHRNTGARQPDNYLIELLLDGNPVASNSLLDASNVIPASTFVDLSTSFTPATAGALTIRLTHSTNDAIFRQGAFDNVRLEAVLPEPATGALALLGAGALGYRRRRQA